ncbi:MAG: VOC family protein [Cyanobacteriota bacterium]
MIKGINHITLSVKDLDISFNFYKDILNFKPIAKWKKGAYFEAGNLWFCLYLDDKIRKEVLSEYSHIALDVSEENFPILSQKIIDYGCKIFKNNTSEGNSLYFLDPNNHKLEIHTSNLYSRIERCKVEPYENMIFFD